MTQRIHLGAIVTDERRLLLVRPEIGTAWELPGAPFREDDDDMDAAMAAALMSYGIVADAIEEDFFETVFLGEPADRTVFNIYAPSAWAGDARAPIGGSIAWFAINEIADLDIDEPIRHAILQAFGLEPRPDPDAQILAALRGASDAPSASAPASALDTSAALQAPDEPHFTSEAAASVGSSEIPHEARIELGRDVLRTLTAGDPAAEANLRARIPELADDVLGALGDTWARDAIDRRTRSLQVVAVLAALGKTGPLRTHLGGALNHGVTPIELIETMRFVAVYAGFPAALEAWSVMEEVFQARGITGEDRQR